MFSSIKKYFSARQLVQYRQIVSRVNALEPEVSALTDDALRQESGALKARVRESGIGEEEVVRAFALAREAARRTLGQRPYDVQILGGLVLHRGAVAEMATGEGKTLAAVAPAYLNALAGRGTHIVTVNEYLTRRDTVWMGQIYRALGLSVACLTPAGAYLYDPEYKAGSENAEGLIDRERDTTGAYLVQQEFLRPLSRREAYAADVTYGTNHEFGFDYLRDNLNYDITQRVQREHFFAIIDEVDSILIDEARTPLIIAAPDAESSEFYKTFARVVANLEEGTDYTVDEKFKSVAIGNAGIEKVEKMIGVANMYGPQNLRLVHYLEESLKAKAIFKRDRDYVVKEDEVFIVDEFTGRILFGRRYTGGLHQAIEAKEGVEVKQESRTYAKISIQNYFRMYEKISGMTGTAQTSAEEFHKVYKLDVVTVPTNRPSVRRDHSDKIYKNMDAKLAAVVADIKERYQRGQPVLMGTTSIAKNEVISDRLRRAGIPHEILNAKNNEREGAIIAQAGRPRAVTVATNMAGRGVDIILGGNPPSSEEARKVKDLGGLYVVGTERHEARRIDNQLRGRSARQGDPGETQFYLSLDDDLLRIFGGERIKGLMERFNLPDDQPIEMGFVSRAVAEAQAKVEGANFDMRKHLLEYDDVLNKQRGAVYRTRQQILTSLNAQDLGRIVFDAAFSHVENVARYAAPSAPETGEGEKIKTVKDHLKEAGVLKSDSDIPDNAASAEDVREYLEKRSEEVSAHPETRNRLLSILDILWMNHLDDLEALQESVNLRAYGQKDPLVEYRREANGLYRAFWVHFNEWTFVNIFRLAENSDTRAATGEPRPATSQPGQISMSHASNQHAAKIGRNNPCYCGSGKKYKKCGLVNTEEHQRFMRGEAKPKHEVTGG